MGGKIVALTVLSADNELAKDVAMQAAAMSPIAINRDSVPADIVEHEKEMIKAEMKNDPKNESKPEDILDKMATLDYQIKSGEVDKYQGIELFFLKIMG
mgnify:CR=1 FL=1